MAHFKSRQQYRGKNRNFMPDNEMVPQTKPAEMSFSDWKKMKSALNTSVENTESTNPPRNLTPASTSKNNNNSKFNNNNNNKNYRDYRNPQSLLYFEQLKQNNLRVFGGRFCNMPIQQQVPMFNRQPTMGNFNQQSSNARPSYVNSRPDPDNFMCTNNNFIMPKSGIVQKPFLVKTGNPCCFPHKQVSLTHPPPKKAMNKHKGGSIKSTEPKVPKTTSTVPTSANKLGEPAHVSSIVGPDAVTQKDAKNQKKRNIRPPKPPTIIATTPESKEEKQRLWREYRQQMKPWKNRNFYNAKRVIQRLGKKNEDELDEKDKERLTRAKETVAAHKAMLTEKAAKRWTLANESTFNSATSVFVRTATKGAPSMESSVNNIVQTSFMPENVNETNHNPGTTSAHTNGNQWSIWNNFVPGGVDFNSTTK